MGYSPWGLKESDSTKQLRMYTSSTELIISTLFSPHPPTLTHLNQK